MKDIDQRIAAVLLQITAKLVTVPEEDSESDETADRFFMLNKKLNDLVRFHRSFVQLQWGEEEVVFRAVCFVNEVMLPSISGQDVNGNWFHFSLQTVLNIVRPIKGPESADGYALLNDMEIGVKQMREMSILS